MRSFQNFFVGAGPDSKRHKKTGWHGDQRLPKNNRFIQSSPIFIMVWNEKAGFALINKVCSMPNVDWNMVERFLMPVCEAINQLSQKNRYWAPHGSWYEAVRATF
jgi:hypothetical protein